MQFRMIMDIELRRLEKSMIAPVQQGDGRSEEADHSRFQEHPSLSRRDQRGNRQQTYSGRVTRSFLNNKSPNFISTHQLSDTLDHTDNRLGGDLPSDCVLFYISGRLIESDILDSAELSHSNHYSFDLTANLLLVRMVTLIHTNVSQFINLALIRVFTQMGLADSVQFYSGATIREEGRGKEADQGWGPLPDQEGHPSKSSVTLEVGVSESHAKLRRDVDWWLHPAKGNANMTVTIKVDRRRPRLMIDRWERIDGVVQSIQHIDISKVNGQIDFVNDSLTIPFASLFLRPPAGNETDIVLDRETFRKLAERIWQLQSF
ncbi:uncharacterized protein N7459_004575 [Penicillium hispanicum]|uniref:uncharacterized protein n=1 Tax=Penicillium hispanicum TaxID=1080232 RepID=UPI00253F9DDF|nr:uncharacterized protein N7459_004575 [Penicillium hispanicum]KAJ5584775.1 hypothetical protein N7459_004575 [Penicillium hispanicum]